MSSVELLNKVRELRAEADKAIVALERRVAGETARKAWGTTGLSPGGDYEGQPPRPDPNDTGL